MNRETIRDIVILASVAACILFINLGAGSLSSWDEAFYAQVSREILESNNWIDLTWYGDQWYDKPPLYMWGTVLSYKLFGVSEFSARFFSALSGVGIVILVYLMGGHLFSRKTGFLAAVMAMSTYHMIWLAKAGTLDVTLTFFLLFSAYCFLRARDNPAWFVPSFITFALAFMTKGIVAVIAPIMFGVYLLMTGEWKIVLTRYMLMGMAAALLVLSLWYYPAISHYGKPFLEGHFLANLIGRTAGALDGHHGNWLTYINVILYKGKPWGTAGLVIFPFFVFNTLIRKNKQNCLLISWVVVVILLFTVAKTKLHWYIIPVYPPLMIIAGWGARKVFRQYATVIVVALALMSVVYFGMNKDIFALDYNPQIKNFSERIEKESAAGKKVYLYDIGDPGMRFYFGGFGERVDSYNELSGLVKGKDAVVVAPRGHAEELMKKGEIINSESGHFSAGIFKEGEDKI